MIATLAGEGAMLAADLFYAAAGCLLLISCRKRSEAVQRRRMAERGTRSAIGILEIKTDGSALHVGWNADFRNCGVVHSGDITHSNAAEYIDIDLSSPLQEIYANINLFSGKQCLKNVKTCYVGMMAVNQIGQKVRHYNPQNCFFTHTMNQKVRTLFYGYIDVQNRFVRFVGQPNTNAWSGRPDIESAGALFPLRSYLNCILEGQGAQEVSSPEEADVILTMGRSLDEKGISLIDNNFFLEC